jgi:hypothetical protein
VKDAIASLVVCFYDMMSEILVYCLRQLQALSIFTGFAIIVLACR